MQPFFLPPTALTPGVELDFRTHQLKISGESFPEDVRAFYSPVFARVHEYLTQSTDAVTHVELAFTYINSASTRSLQQLLKMLDDAASTGRQIRVKWMVLEGDDALTELGEDLLQDKRWLQHEIVQR